MSVVQLFIRATRPLYEFVYPPLCLVCSRFSERRDGGICNECWGSVRSAGAQVGALQQARDRLCTNGPCADVVAPFVFEEGGTIQQVIHLLKYGGRVSSGLALGRKLGEHLCERSRLDILSGVVPVPLHRTKERERGFNQSEVIARGLAEVTGLPVCRENLRRTRFTVSQTRLSAAERHLNVGDAFEVPRQSRILTEGKRFLLVDDVITTGATTAAAASALISAGSLPPVACAVALAH